MLIVPDTASPTGRWPGTNNSQPLTCLQHGQPPFAYFSSFQTPLSILSTHMLGRLMPEWRVGEKV